MIGANEAGWPITAEHDREGDMENVRYIGCLFVTRLHVWSNLSSPTEEARSGVKPDMPQLITSNAYRTA